MTRKKKKKARKISSDRRRRARQAKRKQARRAPYLSSQRQDFPFSGGSTGFSELGDSSLPDGFDVDQLIGLIASSSELADEPEFADFLLDPMFCIDTSARVMEEMGVDPDSLEESPSDEDSALIVRERIVTQLLTDDVRQEILERMDRLLSRRKRSGERSRLSQIALLRLLFQDKSGAPLWPMIGLLHAFLERSLTAGFKLVGQVDRIVGSAEDKDSVLAALDRAGEPGVAEEAIALFDTIPGLRERIESFADESWEKGVQALSRGELYLGLFSLEELEEAGRIMAESLELRFDEEGSLVRGPEASQEQIKEMLTRVRDYGLGLMNQDRLEQARRNVETWIRELPMRDDRFQFVYRLSQELATEDAMEVLRSLVVPAMFGEITALQKSAKDGQEADQQDG